MLRLGPAKPDVAKATRSREPGVALASARSLAYADTRMKRVNETRPRTVYLGNMSERVSESRRVGSVVVHRYSVAGTRGLVVYAAYEASSYFGPHSSLFTIDGQTCGTLPSRRLPTEIDALPVGQERFDAVDAFRHANEAEAYAAIVLAFPEAAEGQRRSGEIEEGSW